jgi:putative drug exporter of the RND superfamily
MRSQASYKCPAIVSSGVERGRPPLRPDGLVSGHDGRYGRSRGPEDGGQGSAWHRWGAAMARHRRAVLLVWVVVLGACAALYPSLKEVLSEPDYKVGGSQSAQVEDLLDGPGFHGAGNEQDAIVFFSARLRASDPVYRGVVARALRAAHSSAGVESVLSPYGGHSDVRRISVDGHAAVARLAMGGNARERFKTAEEVQSAVAHAGGAGVQAWLTGFSALSKDISRTDTADSERGEAIGVPLALVILTLALGAMVAAIVPLLLAGSGVLLTFGVIALIGRVFNFDLVLLTIVTLIGVGIGIDYSLFIVSRFREELARLPEAPRRERRRVAQAVGGAVATSGRTILYSGLVVGLSLTSLLVVRAPVFREFVIGVGAAVVCTLAAALTLLPAVLAQLGPRINAGLLSRRLQPADAKPGASAGQGGWARWALVMMRHPVIVSSGVLLLLLITLAPVLGLRSGIAIDIPSLAETPSGKGALVLARSFSAGMTTPLEVVVTDGSGRRHSPSFGVGVHARAVSGKSNVVRLASATLATELRRDRRVASVSRQSYRSGVLLTVVPAVPVDSTATQALVRRVRVDLAPKVDAREGTTTLAGGWPAQSADSASETTAKLPFVLAITLGLALIFLLVVFRSIVLPLKAVAMNLLATGATLGLVVLVFQDGHGEHLLGFSSPGFIQAYLPLCMFVILFGLSMDYEIFLIRRMQEEWRATGDNRLSVASGVEHTARPISAAAAIMVAVFGSSLVARVLELKEFGFALAMAIAIDATLIRLVLVPALMCLLDARNWWLPDRLARVLPRLELD